LSQTPSQPGSELEQDRLDWHSWMEHKISNLDVGYYDSGKQPGEISQKMP